MIRLLLSLAPVLHFEAAMAVKPTVVYRRPGDEAVLPCGSASPSDAPGCSNIYWLYNKIPDETLAEVRKGKVEMRSVRAARLGLDTNCSLIIRNITAEDAGFYFCRQGTNSNTDASVYISVLTISPSPPDADPKTDGYVILLCSLFRSSDLGLCEQGSILWLDETGAVLLGQGDGFEVLRQTNCASALSVKHQRGHNQRYTCQYVEEAGVRIQAHYTPVFRDVAAEDIYIGTGVGVGLVALLILMSVLIKRRKGTKVTEDLQQPADAFEAQSDVTYSTVSYHNAKVAPQRQVKDEETVTYSVIRAANTDDDPRDL